MQKRLFSPTVLELHHSIQYSENKNNGKAYSLLQPCCDPQKLSSTPHIPVENE
jgi:hypothetical protein